VNCKLWFFYCTDYIIYLYVHCNFICGLSDVIIKTFSQSVSQTERRVPELIPVLGIQPAGDVSHKPGGRLPLLMITFRQARSNRRNPKRAATNFAGW